MTANSIALVLFLVFLVVAILGGLGLGADSRKPGDRPSGSLQS